MGGGTSNIWATCVDCHHATIPPCNYATKPARYQWRVENAIIWHCHMCSRLCPSRSHSIFGHIPHVRQKQGQFSFGKKIGLAWCQISLHWLWTKNMLTMMWMLLTVSCDLKILTLWCFWWEQCGQCCGRYCMLTRLWWRQRWCGSCWRDGWRQSKTLHVDRLVGGGRLRRRKEEMWSQCNMQSHNKQYAT